MMKMLSISAALCLAAATSVAATSVAAQTADPTGAGSRAERLRTRQVEANGRCEGLSYGTGARRCGTRTGGPVGGISGRN